MLKQVCLLKRRPGMSREEFIDYYENHHSKIGERCMPLARRYLRRYIVPEQNPITKEVVEPPYDVVMELWWDTREDFETTMKQLGEGDLFRIIREDEEHIFASHDNPVFTVEEYDSDLPRSVLR
jgi:EthD domain